VVDVGGSLWDASEQVTCGEYNNLDEMGRRIWWSLPSLSASFAPVLRRNHCRPGCVPIWPNFEPLQREPVLDSHASPSLSLPLRFSVQQRPHDRIYTKAATRLRDKMASPLWPSPIFFGDTSDSPAMTILRSNHKASKTTPKVKPFKELLSRLGQRSQLAAHVRRYYQEL
jgi:hypothetical protein